MERMVRITFILALSLCATNAAVLSWDNMLKYSMYGLATNCDSPTDGLKAWTCAWCTFVPIPPVTDITIFESPGAGVKETFGYVGRTNESNFEFNQTHYPPVSGALVHAGFYLSYQQVAGVILPIVKNLQAAYPSLSVISTGHSLGGALSLLNGAALVQGGVKNVEIWNYGQPRVGNSVFATYVNKIISTIYRVVNMHDIVPHLPPTEVDYHHEATEIWFPTNHTVYKICNSSGEDPKCSDSINPAKYSVADHVDYLGYGQTGLHPNNAC